VSRYSIERREWVLRQMMPPGNRSVSELAEETGISAVTLYAWRKQARAAGAVVPGDGKSPEGWSSQEKFRVVLESAGLNETELAQYCRRKGLYVEQIRAWREACEQANASAQERSRSEREQSKAARKRIRDLERERKRDKAALAEAAALLLLRKKAEAIWGKGEDD
jgi:transposase-like protein